MLLTALASLHGCSDSSELEGRESKPQPVITEAVHWQQRFTVVEAVGTSRARQSATLYPEVSDVVTAVSFQAGDRVEEGHYKDGKWVFERVWNGDQTDWGLNFTSRMHVLKVRMASYETQ